MKHLNFLSNLLSLSEGSQSSNIGYDSRATVGSPSGLESSTLLKLVSVLVLVLTIGVGNAWGLSSTVTIGSTNYPTAQTGTTVSGTGDLASTWNVTVVANYFNGNDNGIHAGSNGQTATSIVLTSSSFSGKTITAISVTGRDANGTTNNRAVFTAKVNGSAFGSTSRFTTSSDTYTATGSVACTGNVSVEVVRPSAVTKAIYVSAVSVTFSNGGGATYTVTYSIGTATGTTPTESAKAAGAEFTLHDGTTNITPPNGKLFGGWSDGSNTYAGGATYTMPASAVTLTAQWVNAYTVTYNLNGGTGTTPTESDKASGATFTLHDGTTNITPPSGKVFSKWNDGTSDYDAGDTYTMPSSNVTLTAQWVDAGGDYVLVESAPDSWEGEYLIVYNNTYALNTHNGNVNTDTYATYSDISTYYTSGTKSIASNATTDALAYTIAKTTNGHSISHVESGTTYYLGESANATGAKLRWDNPFTAHQDEWTLGVNSIVSERSSSYAIRWNNNSSSYRFAIYAPTGQQEVQLFKKEESGQTIYLKDNANWQQNDAKYAVYYWDNSTNGWSNFMTAQTDCESTWKTKIPEGYTNMKFVRFNPSDATPGWNGEGHVWNETGNLTIPDGKDCFTLPAEAGSGSTNGTSDANWSAYAQKVTVSFAAHASPLSDPDNQCVVKTTGHASDVSYTRLGYSLTGWFTEEAGGDQWNFATGTFSEDKTLHAHWTQPAGQQIYLKPSWSGDGNTWVKDGRIVFAHFYINETTQYLDVQMTGNSCDDVLTATAPYGTTHVSFARCTSGTVAGDLAATWETNDHVNNYVTGLSLAANYYYSITGWGSGKVGTGQKESSAYSPATFTIQYNDGGTSYTSGNTITGSHSNDTKNCGENLTLPGETFHTTGYTQTGWTTTAGGSETNALSGTYSTEAAQTFYPAWTTNTHKFAWDWGSGSTSSTTHTAANNAMPYGTPITKPANNTMSRNGYTFNGWSSDATTMPDNDLTITAQWQANQYTVTLDANGGVDGATTSVNTTFGEAMPTIEVANLPTREGYSFDGFYTGKTDGTKYYNADGTSARNQARYSDNQKLYAHWKAKTMFSVNGVVNPLLTIDDGEAMPSATVPVSCGDCWAFMGWSEDPDESSAIDYAAGATHTFGSSTTLYAVFGKSVYQRVSQTSDLEANGLYALAVYDESEHPLVLSNTGQIHYPNDGAVTDYNSNYSVVDADHIYLKNISLDHVWKFTGTYSSGQLQNMVSSDYLNISDADESIYGASCNLTFAASAADAKAWDISYSTTNYLHGYADDGETPKYGGYEILASGSWSSSRLSSYIFKQIESTISTSPSCDTYTIAWKVGSGNATGSPTTSTNTCTGIEDLPNTPADNSLACATKFMGWSESTLVGPGKEEPVDLFTTVGGAPKIDDNKEFHAVFASVDTESESPASVTSTFTSTSWGDENSLWTSDKDATGTGDSRGVQVNKAETGAGATTNDSYNKVTSVVITYGSASSAAGSIAVSVGGTAMTLSSGSISGGQSDQTLTYTPTAPATSLTGVVSFVATVTNKSIYIKSIQINYKTFGYKDYMTSCCDELVTLSTSITGSGTITFSPASPIATCDDDKNVTMTITPAAGYKLKTWAVATGVGYVDADDTDPAVVTDEDNSTPQSIALTFNQHKSGTYAVAATFEAMHDEYYDYMHDNGKVGGNRIGTYSAPNKTSKTATSGEDCKTNHYKFKGWVVSSEIYDDGTLKSGYTLITAGTSMTASNKIYYAIWAEEE